MKPYSFITFVNIGNSITGIDTVLINFMMFTGCLKFAIRWGIIYPLNLMNWTFSLLSVDDSNTFKISSSHVNLLLWCWIDCWLSPLLFWFLPLVWCWLSPFPWLVSLPPWFSFTWSFSPGVEAWIFLCISVCVDGIRISTLTSFLFKNIQTRL